MKKKIIITLLVILAVIVPVSVFTGFAGETGIAAQSADTVSIDTEPMDPGVMSDARREALEYKKKVLSGEIELEEDTNPVVNNIAALTDEKLIAEREALHRYMEQAIALINKKLNRNYEVYYSFDRELTSAAVEILKTQRLTDEEYTLLKNYAGEYTCALKDGDPLKDDILEIYGLTKAEYYGFSDDSVITQEEQSAVDSYLASRTE